MIKNFEELKKQFIELAEVVNRFKSEAVQLRVLGLMLPSIDIEFDEMASPAHEKFVTKTKGNRGKKSKIKVESKGEKLPRKPRKGKGGRPGPGAMVSQLTEEGFFKKPKTVQDIIDHCQSVYAYKYVPNELAVTMTRALRNGLLKRQKNDQKQFEYVS